MHSNNGDIEHRYNSEKKIAQKLANVRNIIQNKYKKAQKERVIRERDLKDKYKPITSAIEKLADKKKTERPPYERPPQHIYDSADENIYDSVANSEDDSMDTDSWSDSSASENEGDGDQDGGADGDGQREEAGEVLDLPGPSGIATKRKTDVAPETDAVPDSNKKHAPSLKSYQKYLMKKAYVKGRKTVASKKKSRIIRPRSDTEDDNDDIVEKRHKKSTLTRGEKFRMNDLQRARDIREGVALRRKEVADSQLPHFQPISDDEVVVLTDDEEDDGDVVEGRTAPSKRKATAPPPSQRKYMAVSKIDADRKKKFLNYPGVKKISHDLLLRSTRKRKNMQKTPYHLGRVPSINTPYLTREHILHRSLIPAIPDNRPAFPGITVIKVKKNKNSKGDKEKKGSGLESDFITYKENTNYEFYDDANELCDRLRLLVASRVAGNTNHAQEINSIISELREAKYIL